MQLIEKLYNIIKKKGRLVKSKYRAGQNFVIVFLNINHEIC